jgi:hypothetical protein
MIVSKAFRFRPLIRVNCPLSWRNNKSNGAEAMHGEGKQWIGWIEQVRRVENGVKKVE